MPRHLLRIVFGATVVLLCVGFPWLLGGLSRGQEKQAGAKQGAEKGPAKTEPFFIRAKQGCVGSGCHGNPIDKPQNLDTVDPNICRMNEYSIWEKSDKHKQAYAVLDEPRGKQMAKNLGENFKKDDCVACHGVVIKNAKIQNGFDLKEEGVTCCVCHGADIRWVKEHSFSVTKDEWHALSRGEKEKDYGMIDLWDPAKRANLCASCHVGSVKEGKFVTHKMYAAGHPPLPSFELTTFGDQMPKHWQTTSQKPEAVQKLIQKNDKVSLNELEQTKLVLVGAAASLRDSMDLLSSQSKKAMGAKDDDDKLLNFSNFDCYACHHELKGEGWRPKRGYPGIPGRVPMAPWASALVPLAIQFAAADPTESAKQMGEYEAAHKEVQKGFDAQPFGVPAKIAPAAEKLGKWADQLGKEVKDKPLDGAAARTVLNQLVTYYKDKILDYDSARQVAWAFRVIYKECYPTESPEIKPLLADLDTQLRLDLPAGPNVSIMKELDTNLKARNDYDPDKFKATLSALGAALPKAK